MLHCRLSKGRPEHMLPPPDGGGLLQRRRRIWLPGPHVEEQASHGAQLDHEPLTLPV